MRIVWLAAPVLLLGACQKADNKPGPGEVTMGEAGALHEAGQMIEDQRLPAATVPPAREAGPTPDRKPPG